MGREYVGIDLHRRRSVIVRVAADGTELGVQRIVNGPSELAGAVAAAGRDAVVVLEATYGWYWAVDVLQQELGLEVHLAHPLGLSWGSRRRKDDVADARDLADMLRMGRLPEGWIAPPATRAARELVRYRAKLVQLRSGLKAQVHSVLAKQGVPVTVTDVFGVGGKALLDGAKLDVQYRYRTESLRRLVEVYDVEVVELDRCIAKAFAGHRGYEALQAIKGVGPVIAAVFVAEVGDVSRFKSADHLCSWAGLTPRHRESDTMVVRGRITKQGSPLVRWAAHQAAMAVRPGHPLYADFVRIAERRGRKIARVAMARRIVGLAYWALRDNHIRFLDKRSAA